MASINTDAFEKRLLQLRNTFLEEVPEKLERLDQLLLEMEKDSACGDAFDEFYRIVHSLKGSGGTFGLHIITTICHQVEDLLNTTEGGAKYTSALISFTLEYIDLLRMAVGQIHAGNTQFPQIQERLEALHRRLAKKQLTVLVVDDSRLWTQIYLQALAGLPARPVVADDGYMALMRVLTEPFDLLITTNETPGLNGVALIGALRLSTSKNRHIKTILVTANPAITQKKRFTDADYVIAKDAGLAQKLVDVTQTILKGG